MTREQVIEACGIPEGLRWRATVIEGLWNLRVCSAPAFVYGQATIMFGCNDGVAGLGGPQDGLLQVSVNSLLEDAARSSRLVVPTLGALAHQEYYSAVERERVRAFATTTSQSGDPVVLRAAQLVLDALSPAK